MEKFNPNKHIAENLADLEAQGFGYWEDGEWHHTGMIEMLSMDLLANLTASVQSAINKITWSMLGAVDIKPGDK